VDHGNKFNEFLSKVESLKNLQGPIYELGDVGRHHFAEIEQKAEKLKQVRRIFQLFWFFYGFFFIFAFLREFF